MFDDISAAIQALRATLPQDEDRATGEAVINILEIFLKDLRVLASPPAKD